MFGEVLCLPILLINHSETDRDAESSHQRETENSNNEAEQLSQRGCWEKKRKMRKNGSSLCSGMLANWIEEYLAISSVFRANYYPITSTEILQTAFLQVRNPLRADKQEFREGEASNHTRRMKKDCNALEFISPGQKRTCPLLFTGQDFTFLGGVTISSIP